MMHDLENVLISMIEKHDHVLVMDRKGPENTYEPVSRVSSTRYFSLFRKIHKVDNSNFQSSGLP